MTEDLKKNEYKIKQVECPECKFDQANLITHLMDIPYYEDYLMISIACNKCGYRTSDFLNLTHKGHLRFEYLVDSIEDQNTKIVRAREATVEIPELGVKLEPVGDATSWIRNIEGVLLDFQEKIELAVIQSGGDEEARLAGEKCRYLIDEMLMFNQPFTLVVDDPSGNSLIIPTQPAKLVRIEKDTESQEE
ncbi:MAG: ZPR1 zinc finger domain-containing protein [Candidatus Heimdallarchaeota archaeon]|nr:ZPR1 zinc finger domain-containing protein [Candidatus Heimdallarchaeota archaeon]MDH5644453.1 ZPR1 zinc finger domain-containing protein [Candidatus Heimdallarchaeota archaeon]